MAQLLLELAVADVDLQPIALRDIRQLGLDAAWLEAIGPGPADAAALSRLVLSADSASSLAALSNLACDSSSAAAVCEDAPGAAAARWTA